MELVYILAIGSVIFLICKVGIEKILDIVLGNLLIPAIIAVAVWIGFKWGWGVALSVIVIAVVVALVKRSKH